MIPWVGTSEVEGLILLLRFEGGRAVAWGAVGPSLGRLHESVSSRQGEVMLWCMLTS